MSILALPTGVYDTEVRRTASAKTSVGLWRGVPSSSSSTLRRLLSHLLLQSRYYLTILKWDVKLFSVRPTCTAVPEDISTHGR